MNCFFSFRHKEEEEKKTMGHIRRDKSGEKRIQQHQERFHSETEERSEVFVLGRIIMVVVDVLPKVLKVIVAGMVPMWGGGRGRV